MVPLLYYLQSLDDSTTDEYSSLLEFLETLTLRTICNIMYEPLGYQNATEVMNDLDLWVDGSISRSRVIGYFLQMKNIILRHPKIGYRRTKLLENQQLVPVVNNGTHSSDTARLDGKNEKEYTMGDLSYCLKRLKCVGRNLHGMHGIYNESIKIAKDADYCSRNQNGYDSNDDSVSLTGVQCDSLSLIPIVESSPATKITESKENFLYSDIVYNDHRLTVTCVLGDIEIHEDALRGVDRKTPPEIKVSIEASLSYIRKGDTWKLPTTLAGIRENLMEYYILTESKYPCSENSRFEPDANGNLLSEMDSVIPTCFLERPILICPFCVNMERCEAYGAFRRHICNLHKAVDFLTDMILLHRCDQCLGFHQDGDLYKELIDEEGFLMHVALLHPPWIKTSQTERMLCVLCNQLIIYNFYVQHLAVSHCSLFVSRVSCEILELNRSVKCSRLQAVFKVIERESDRGLYGYEASNRIKEIISQGNTIGN